MKKTKTLKRVIAFTAVILTVLLSVPVQGFASGETYVVYEDFNSQSSVNGFASTIPIATDGNASGQIKLHNNNGDKSLIYDKTQNITDKALYTDVYFGNRSTKCPQGASFVFEVTFWYTGDISNVSWGELVGGRKEVQKTDKNGNLLFKDKDKTIPDMGPDMKVFLQIKNGKLYTGAGTEAANLVTNLEPNKKYKVAISVHDEVNKYDVYLGENAQVATQKNVPYKSNTGTYFTGVRGLNLTGMTVSSGGFPDFYADDFMLYYADKPKSAGGVPSMNVGGNTGNEGGANTDNQGGADSNIPATPTVPTVPESSGSELGTIKLPKVEQKEFNFTAVPQSTTAVESNPVKLEDAKDILWIVGIGGGSVLIIALVIVFNKKFN